MRLYDIVVVLSPEETAEQTQAVLDGFKKILTDGQAKILVEDPWGRRRLAYSIGRRKEGIYHYWQAEAAAETIAELERKMRLSDEVLRHMAVRVDEELRRAEKLKARRQQKAARRPPKSAPAAAAESATPADVPVSEA